MTRSIWLVSTAGALLLVAACAPRTFPTTLTTEWETRLELNRADRSHVSEDGSRIIVGQGKSMQIVAGDGSIVIDTPGERGIAERLEVFVNATARDSVSMRLTAHPVSRHAGAALRAYREAERSVGANTYSYRMLPNGTLFVFEPQMEGNDLIWGFDLGSSRALWLNDSYAWSASGSGALAEQAVQAAATRIGRSMAAALGGEHREDQGETAHERADRLTAHAHGLVEPLRDGRTSLLKTTDGLVLLDTETGRERWRIDDFPGMGMVSVIELGGGHAVVVSGNMSWAGIPMGPNRIARVDLDRGALVWRAEYDGGRIDNVLHDETVLVVDGHHVQAFALGSGEKLWEQEHSLKNAARDIAVAPVLRDGRLFVTGDVLREDVRVVRASVPNIVRGYDARTGRVLWTTESAARDYRQIEATDGLVLVAESGQMNRGSGGIFALDPETGVERWRSEEFEAVGLTRTGSAVPISRMFVENGVVFVAGQNAVYGFDVRSGQTRFRADHREAEVGTVRALLDHRDLLVAVSSGGVAAYAKADGSRRFATGTETHSFRTAGNDFYTVAGNTLWLTHQKGTTGIDLGSGRIIGTVAPADYGERFVHGDLLGGTAFLPDGRSLYELGEVCERRRCGLSLRKLTVE